MLSRSKELGKGALILAGLLLAHLFVGGGASAPAQEGQAPEGVKRFTIRLAEEGAPAGRFLFAGPEAKRVTISQVTAGEDYWLGLQLTSLDELALAQLNLKQAVAAEGVLPDSPAEKAGVQKHDVLLQFGETPIGAPEDLIAAVEKNKDQEAELKVLRGGKEFTIKITPAKRPAQKVAGLGFTPGKEEARRIETWLQRLGKGEGGGDTIELHVVRPGVLFGFQPLEFPQDLSVSISKTGNEPVKISVKRGEKSWETTADKIGELPAEVRPYVESLLAQHGAGPMRLWAEKMAREGAAEALKAPPAVPGLGKIHVREFEAAGKSNLDAVHKQLQDLLKRVEEMQARAKEEDQVQKLKGTIDQLRKELDELRKSPKKPEK